ncbi:MAG: hypothetical protein HC802_17350 [Caldilineaceae bacterium]|nr:hypothetical protein [Caldilineaceae bacterium]
MTLTGRGASTIRTVYESENRFEFLAPNLGWLGEDRLLLARSRFAAGDVFGLDRFGVVQVQLPAADAPGSEPPTSTSYLFPTQQELKDFATCADGDYTLLVSTRNDGGLELSRWAGSGEPEPLFVLPANLSRTFVCWQAPDPVAAP